MSKYTYTLAHPARVSTQKGDNPVHVASFWGNTESLRLLLEDNADANTPNVKEEMTPLMLAVKGGHSESAKLLLENNADPNAQTKEEMTPLMLAVKGGHSESAKLLLEKRANPNAQNSKEMTPLMLAVEGGHLESVKVLLEKRANPNAQNSEDETLLMIAAKSGLAPTSDIVVELINAAVNAANDDIAQRKLEDIALRFYVPYEVSLKFYVPYVSLKFLDLGEFLGLGEFVRLRFYVGFMYAVFIMWWPTRPWERATKPDSKGSWWSLLRSTLACVCLVVSLLTIFNYTASFWKYLADLIAAYYLHMPFPYYVPAGYLLSLALGFIIYVFRKEQFLYVYSTSKLFTFYAIFAFMAHMTGVSWLLMFIYETWIHLTLVTFENTWFNQWLLKTFRACVCTLRISYFVPPIWLLVLFPAILFAVSRVHDSTRHQFQAFTSAFTGRQKDYGVVTGRNFVENNWKLFFLFFFATGICALVDQPCLPFYELMAFHEILELPFFCTPTSSDGYPDTISNVFCKIDPGNQLACVVDVQYYDPSDSGASAKQVCDNYNEWDFCGTWQLNTVHDRDGVTIRAIPATCPCPASRACLATKQTELVLAASQHNTKIYSGDVVPNGTWAYYEHCLEHYAELFLKRSLFNSVLFLFSSSSLGNRQVIETIDTMLRETIEYYVEFSIHKLESFVPSLAGKQLFITGLRKEGFKCYFETNKTNNEWRSNITTWGQPFKPVDGYLKWSPRESVVLPKEIHMKLDANMLTPAGFISVGLGGEGLEPQAKQAFDRKLYVGISGGGWRSLSGNAGVFRALGNKNILGMVEMFSSVSGGTWFLMKLSFDEAFSMNILNDDIHITEVILAWMEREYFPVIRNPAKKPGINKTSEGIEGCFLSTIILQAIEPIRSALGLDFGTVAVNHFDFSWKEMVEQAVLGENIGYQNPLASTALASEARARFGSAKLAFNWNMLHQWEDAKNASCSKWFLKDAGGHYLQYPSYTSGIYKMLSNGTIDFEVKMQGKAMNDLFQVCRGKRQEFCDDYDTSNGFLSYFQKKTSGLETICDDFAFHNLTVGQVASASSAFGGGMAVQPWVQSIVEIARQKAQGVLKGPMNVLCADIYKMVTDNLVAPCNPEVVRKELHTFLGCETKDIKKEPSLVTAKRWSRFLRKMAIPMTLSSPLGNNHVGHMAIDAGYNDNSGLGPIIAEYLQDESAHGQILVVIINQLGDLQMRTYFNSTEHEAGMICEEETDAEGVFSTIKEIHRKSFKDIGGEYVERGGKEKTCAIRLAQTAFFKGYPPPHRHFDDNHIPAHITYAYQTGVTILENEDFYTLPVGVTKQVDLLFLIASAPVPTGAFPEGGSESYVGLAIAMELAMGKLIDKFPAFFSEAVDPPREHKMYRQPVLGNDYDEMAKQLSDMSRENAQLVKKMNDMARDKDQMAKRLSDMSRENAQMVKKMNDMGRDKIYRYVDQET